MNIRARPTRTYRMMRGRETEGRRKQAFATLCRRFMHIQACL